MRLIKTLALATTLVAGSTAAFAEGTSTEADGAQVIRQSVINFVMQDRAQAAAGRTARAPAMVDLQASSERTQLNSQPPIIDGSVR